MKYNKGSHTVIIGGGEIFWMRQFHVKMLGIDINGTFMKSVHNAFYEIFRKMKLWTGKYFPIFLFYRLI